MAEQTLYVPHAMGVLIGSRDARAWLARDAVQAVTTAWRGQPVFAAATDAFGWLGWARSQPWLPDGIAVAHVTAHTDRTSEGIQRVHIGASQLHDPAHQVLRAHADTPGPDEQILAACHGMARAGAARVWLIGSAGATATVRRATAMATAWDYGYRIAARDVRTAVAGQVERSVHAAGRDAQATALDADHGELARLLDAATTLAAGAALVTVPDLPDRVRDEARHVFRAGGDLSGWNEALTVVWRHALRTGALHGVLDASAHIETVWRAGPRATQPHAARIQAQPAEQWVAATLIDANRAVAAQWLLATSQHLPAATAHPHAAAAPTNTATDRADEAGVTATPAPEPPSPSAGRAFATPVIDAHQMPPAAAAPPADSGQHAKAHPPQRRR